MFICFNCRQFVSTVHQCEHCNKNVCPNCILIGDLCGTKPHFNPWSQLCSKCQCASCIEVKGGKLIVGYDICTFCGLQYCNDCFQNTLCSNSIEHDKN